MVTLDDKMKQENRMESELITKQNDATKNRPEGDRLLDAPVIKIDIGQLTNQLLSEKAWKKNKKNAITLYKTDKIRILLIALRPGKDLHTELPNNNLIFQMLSGKLGIRIHKKMQKLKKGEILTVHERQDYSVECFKRSIFLLTVIS
jgi:hypothetical protein